MEKRRAIRVVAPILAVALFLVIWQAACTFEWVPAFMLPSPLGVISTLIEDAELISTHALATIAEALIGLACGLVLGFIIAVLMERFYMLPKVLLVTLTTFFPITVSLASGFKSVDEDEVDLLRTMGATRMQIFRYVKLPASAGSFFSGLRISATYAVVAAVVAEWLGGFNGLGVFMTRVRKSYDYEAMFAAIVVISLVSLLFMGVTRLLERACMPWMRGRRSKDGD